MHGKHYIARDFFITGISTPKLHYGPYCASAYHSSVYTGAGDRACEIPVGDTDVPLPARHSSSPLYLYALLRRVADVPTRRRLRSASSDALLVRPTRLVIIGDRAFRSLLENWKELPGDITAAQSLTAFRNELKTYLFRRSYPDLI
jgi:hypothetical protein